MRKLLTLFVLGIHLAIAQTIDVDAILRKSEMYEQSKEYDKGIKYLQGVIKKNQFYGELWDKLVSFYQLKEKSSNHITLTEKDLLNKKSIQDLLIKALEKPNYYQLIYTARYGAACGYGSTWCEILLRSYLVDHDTDTSVVDEAKEYFNEAEKEFGNRNFEKAITNYKKAVEIYPGYYHANLYLGDTYYAMKDYKNAIKYFKQSVEAEPDLLEPRKYLVDAYLNSGAYEYALTACIEGICVYPDFSMMIKLKDIQEQLGKKFVYQKLIRTVLPGGMGLSPKTQKGVVIVKTDKNSIWNLYSQGLQNFRNANNGEEIIYNKKTNIPLQYQEIEAWKYMLKNSNSNYLSDAKKADEDGYLDCYVMIDNFHYDFYDQFKIWIAQNKEKTTTYLTTYRTQ